MKYSLQNVARGLSVRWLITPCSQRFQGSRWEISTSYSSPDGLTTILSIRLHWGTHYTLHYTTLHYTTLHYTTLRFTTLHYTTLHYTTLHYTTQEWRLFPVQPHQSPAFKRLVWWRTKNSRPTSRLEGSLGPTTKACGGAGGQLGLAQMSLAVFRYI